MLFKIYKKDMILNNSVFIKMNAKHISKYWSIGYKCKVNEIVEILIKDIPLNSHIIIDVKCDVCDNTKKIKYQVYNKSFSKEGYYSCSVKCGVSKYKNTCLDKYGFNNYSKTIESKIRISKTCIDKYGEKSPAQNYSIMSKIKDTCINKYGVDQGKNKKH